MSFRLKKSFDSSKCKTLLQLTLQRLKVLRNKHALALKRSRADVAKLLERGQDSNAKMQVESVLTEQKVVALYDLLEQFCQLVINRLESIKSQRECPSDLKEAVASLIFAAPKCADLEELQKVSKLLASKYGTEFSVAAKELRPDCGVNTQIIQNLSSVSPNSDAKLKLLKEIAVESNINWDYEMAIADTLKGAPDLLDGPNHFESATQLSSVGTQRIPDKQNPRSMSMHVNETRGQASTVLQNDFGLRTMSSVEKSSSLVSPIHNRHQFAKINTSTETEDASFSLRASGGELHTPVLDPYALAKAQGQMDYKVVSDYLKSAHVTDIHLKSTEWKQEKEDAAVYYKHVAQDHNVFIDASYNEDSLQRSKEKKENENVRDLKKGHKSRHQEDLSTFHEISKGRNEAELLDLKTAAEIAFVAASQAAEAARAAANMVRMESFERSKGSRVVNVNKLQEKHVESSSDSVRDENRKLAGMDTEIFSGTESCGSEDEIESSRDNLVDGKQEPEPIFNTSEDSLKYVVFEQTSDSHKYAQSSAQEEGYNMKAESYAFPQVWSDTTQHSSRDSDRVISWDAEHEEPGSMEMPTSHLFDSFYDRGKELDRKASSRKMEERIFDHAEVQQDKFVQNDFSVPQFDDYISEESSEEEPPFYLKGRAAMVTEDDYSRGAWAASSKKNIVMPTSDFIYDDQVEESSSSYVHNFIDDDQVEESSSSYVHNLKQEASLHLDYHAEFLDVANHMEKHSITVNGSDQNYVRNHSQEPSLHGYADSVSFLGQSFRTRSHVSIESISEKSVTSPVPNNDSSGKPEIPPELGWQSPTSQRSDLDSSHGKMLSALSSVKLRSLDEGFSGYEDRRSNLVNRKLKLYSGASEDLELVSERSFASQNPRCNPSLFEKVNLESPKPSMCMEDGTKVSKLDPGLTLQVPPALQGKSFFGISKRSVRSNRTKQTQDGPS